MIKGNTIDNATDKYMLQRRTSKRKSVLERFLGPSVKSLPKLLSLSYHATFCIYMYSSLLFLL